MTMWSFPELPLQLSKLKHVRPFNYSLSLSLTAMSVTSWFGITLLCWKCSNHGGSSPSPPPSVKSSIWEKTNKQRITVRVIFDKRRPNWWILVPSLFCFLSNFEMLLVVYTLLMRRISQTSCSVHFLAVFSRFAPCMHLSLLGSKHLKFVNFVFKRFIAGRLAIVWLFMRRWSVF